jgi:kynureninase
VLDELADPQLVRLLTPREPERRGCQLSLGGGGDAAGVAARLQRDHGVVGDVRKPNVLRLAPAPLYSTYEECWRAVDGLVRVLAEP